MPGVAQLGQRRLDDGKAEPETASQLGAGEITRQVQRLQDQLQHEIERQPGLGEGQRRGRVAEDPLGLADRGAGTVRGAVRPPPGLVIMIAWSR